MSGRKVLACVNLVWRPVEMSVEEFVARHLDALNDCAAAIARLLLDADNRY